MQYKTDVAPAATPWALLYRDGTERTMFVGSRVEKKLMRYGINWLPSGTNEQFPIVRTSAHTARLDIVTLNYCMCVYMVVQNCVYLF
jgi:hypothetical protein